MLKVHVILFELILSLLILSVLKLSTESLGLMDFLKPMIVINVFTVLIYSIVILIKNKYKNSKYLNKETEIRLNLNSDISVKAVYYGHNTVLDIQGIQILDSLLYIADNNQSLDYLNEIPFLVQLKLPIAKRKYNYQDNKNRKLSSYTGMSQKEKLEFLLWIEGKCSGEMYNKDFIYIYVEGLRYNFFTSEVKSEQILLRVISIYKEYKNLDRKIKSYLEETILYMIIELDFFDSRKELSLFITNELELEKYDSFRYRLLLDYVIHNGIHIDEFYLVFLHSILYKDLNKHINNKNRKLLLEIFREEFKEEFKEFSIKEDSLKFKNYKIDIITYVFSQRFEERINKFVEKVVSDLKMFLLVSKGKSYEEAFHFLPEKYKKKFVNPLFGLMLNNIDNKSGIYKVKDIIQSIPQFSEVQEKMNQKETKFFHQLITDGQWSIEPDYRITGKNYRLDQLVNVYKLPSNKIEETREEVKFQVLLDSIYSMINIELTPSKRKIIFNLFEDSLKIKKDSVDRIRKRLALLEAGVSVELNNLSKVKFSKDEVNILENFFEGSYKELLFTENKKIKFLSLISE